MSAAIPPAQLSGAAIRPNSSGRLAPGDLLIIACDGEPNPVTRSAKPVRIDANGEVSLFSFGEPVKIGGLTPAEAERAIVEAYNSGAPLTSAGTVYIRRIETGKPPPCPIGKWDLVRVEMWDLLGPGTPTIQIRRVQSDGTFSLPYVGAWKLAGLTEIQAERALMVAYAKANLLQNVRVSVLILETAPPDAANLDPPDEPLNPVAPALQWLYDDGVAGYGRR